MIRLFIASVIWGDSISLMDRQIKITELTNHRINLSKLPPGKHELEAALVFARNVDEASRASQVALYIPVIKSSKFPFVERHRSNCACPEKIILSAPVGGRKIGQHR